MVPDYDDRSKIQGIQGIAMTMRRQRDQPGPRGDLWSKRLGPWADGIPMQLADMYSQAPWADGNSQHT
jgi:hypothetical protein